jgi:hypothetical protein
MINLAGREKSETNAQCAAELEAAGIEVHRMPTAFDGEVKTNVLGSCGPWSFRRAWYYWVAKGPGIPVEVATVLHEKHGKDVRVDGHCGCPSPQEWCKGFAVGLYHVDSAEGLKALADTIKDILGDV